MDGNDGIVLPNVVRIDRIGVHSHIKGLGLTTDETDNYLECGLVGQIEARRAAGI